MIYANSNHVMVGAIIISPTMINDNLWYNMTEYRILIIYNDGKQNIWLCHIGFTYHNETHRIPLSCNVATNKPNIGLLACHSPWMTSKCMLFILGLIPAVNDAGKLKYK